MISEKIKEKLITSEVNGTDGIAGRYRINKNRGRLAHQMKGPGRTVNLPQRPRREEAGGKRSQPARAAANEGLGC